MKASSARRDQVGTIKHDNTPVVEGEEASGPFGGAPFDLGAYLGTNGQPVFTTPTVELPGGVTVSSNPDVTTIEPLSGSRCEAGTAAVWPSAVPLRSRSAQHTCDPHSRSTFRPLSVSVVVRLVHLSHSRVVL
jgi:hypothetical protein